MSDIAVESTPEKPKNLMIFDTETNGVPKKSGIHKGFVYFNDPEFTVRLL